MFIAVKENLLMIAPALSLVSASSELTTLQTVSSETMPSTVGDIGPSDEKVCTAQDASSKIFFKVKTFRINILLDLCANLLCMDYP